MTETSARGESESEIRFGSMAVADGRGQGIKQRMLRQRQEAARRTAVVTAARVVGGWLGHLRGPHHGAPRVRTRQWEQRNRPETKRRLHDGSMAGTAILVVVAAGKMG